MSLTAFELHQLNLLDQLEAGRLPASADDTREMASLGFVLSTRQGISLTPAGRLHLANLRSHVRDEVDDRMLHWGSAD